jgi:hypothetical protein
LSSWIPVLVAGRRGERHRSEISAAERQRGAGDLIAVLLIELADRPNRRSVRQQANFLLAERRLVVIRLAILPGQADSTIGA